MSRDTLGVTTGLAVLVIGVIAVANVLRPADEPAAESSAVASATVAVSEPVAGQPVEELPGIGPGVIRVLRWSGNVQLADDGELAQVPPSVAAVLIQYGVPLRVPVDSEKMQ